MHKALLIAALMITTSIGIAHAGDSWSFQVNGQKVSIERPRNCTSLSCVNIVAPGFNSSSSDDKPASNPPPQTNQPAASAPMQQPVQQVQQPPMQQQQVATAPAMTAPVTATVPPLPGQADASSNVTTLPAPNTVTPPALPQVAQPVQQPVQQYQQPVQQVQQPMPQQQVATVAPTQQVAPAQVVANSPIGMWMTEKNEGKIHVVNCGTNICGYSVDKNGADAGQVLINMKPDGNSWKGRIHDTRGGGNYDATIALRGNDGLRVQGCAFGGMFCGGQTWTRAN